MENKIDFPTAKESRVKSNDVNGYADLSMDAFRAITLASSRGLYYAKVTHNGDYAPFIAIVSLLREFGYTTYCQSDFGNSTHTVEIEW